MRETIENIFWNCNYTSTLVENESECLGKSTTNFALFPVNPLLVSWSILYFACNEGNNEAVILKLCHKHKKCKKMKLETKTEKKSY